MSKKIILHIDHAPDYREEFLRILATLVDLVVIAHPCSTANLQPPKERIGYKYYELVERSIVGKLYNREFIRIIEKEMPDALCIALNVRHPFRLLTFLLRKDFRKKWIWWGQVLGRSESSLLLKLKKNLITKSQGTLTYSEDIVKELGMESVYSFNNSQFAEKDYIELDNRFDGVSLRCLFVGRPQERKKLEKLFELAEFNPNLSFRLVGPQMEEYFKDKIVPPNVELYGAASGDKLRGHFQWSNVVINPGHVGLLVMNAACHNRAIIINKSVNHAPEIILARESDQFLIDFEGTKEVSDFLDNLRDNPNLLNEKAKALFKRGKEAYTVEYMAKVHKKIFDQTIEKIK